MPEQQSDYSQIYDFLYRIDRRIGNLEKDATFIEKNITHLDIKKANHFDVLKDELQNTQQAMKQIKMNFSRCVGSMSSMGKELRNVVKQEEMQEVHDLFDALQFEEYIMKQDLRKNLKAMPISQSEDSESSNIEQSQEPEE